MDFARVMSSSALSSFSLPVIRLHFQRSNELASAAALHIKAKVLFKEVVRLLYLLETIKDEGEAWWNINTPLTRTGWDPKEKGDWKDGFKSFTDERRVRAKVSVWDAQGWGERVLTSWHTHAGAVFPPNEEQMQNRRTGSSWQTSHETHTVCYAQDMVQEIKKSKMLFLWRCIGGLVKCIILMEAWNYSLVTWILLTSPFDFLSTGKKKSSN